MGKSEMEPSELLSREPHRPKYHFLPPANWINDPNGPIYYKEEYHLFYQHNPEGDTWGNIHWGHAKSKDLVFWQHLPIALKPSHEKGEEHCFSGTCVLNDNIPTIIYTSIGHQRDQLTGAEQWIAFSTDDMVSWIKHKKNPIMTLKIHGNLQIWDWRDPHAWKEGNQWYMVLSGHVREKKRLKKPVVLLYSSSDLIHWKFIKILCLGEGSRETGKNWECPNFFSLRGKEKRVLIVSVSPKKKVIYTIGMWKDQDFKHGKWHLLDYGKWMYAPATMKEPSGRILMWGWIFGGGEIKGWNGCLTLPRELKEGSDNRLLMRPVKELEKLRERHVHFENITIASDSLTIMEGIEDKCVELIIQFKNPRKEIFKLKLSELTTSNREVFLTMDLASNKIQCGEDECSIDPHDIKKEENMLHVFIDNSVIEVFFNHIYCLTTRYFFKIRRKSKLMIAVKNGAMKFKKIDAWSIKSIWNE
ncbi:MAG: glycoside hydrolase family 32 protein [Promethearchaeota archaeon]